MQTHSLISNNTANIFSKKLYAKSSKHFFQSIVKALGKKIYSYSSVVEWTKPSEYTVGTNKLLLFFLIRPLYDRQCFGMKMMMSICLSGRGQIPSRRVRDDASEVGLVPLVSFQNYRSSPGAKLHTRTHTLLALSQSATPTVSCLTHHRLIYVNKTRTLYVSVYFIICYWSLITDRAWSFS
jgi:hypothetical protein